MANSTVQDHKDFLKAFQGFLRCRLENYWAYDLHVRDTSAEAMPFKKWVRYGITSKVWRPRVNIETGQTLVFLWKRAEFNLYDEVYALKKVYCNLRAKAVQ